MTKRNLMWTTIAALLAGCTRTPNVSDTALVGKWDQDVSPTIVASSSPSEVKKQHDSQAANPLEIQADHTFTWPNIGTGTWAAQGNGVKITLTKSESGMAVSEPFDYELSTDLKHLGYDKKPDGSYGMSFTRER